MLLCVFIVSFLLIEFLCDPRRTPLPSLSLPNSFWIQGHQQLT